jgi:predicted DNA-binding protein (UPF0278 family)
MPSLPSPSWRAKYIEDVRRRLDEGELDSDDAVLETAFALLDGDPAPDDD